MARISYKKVEQDLRRLAKAPLKEIGYVLLNAFGAGKAAIKRYKDGKGNFGKDGDLVVKKKLAYRPTSSVRMTDELEALKLDEEITKHKPRLLIVSDGQSILAYDPIRKETYDNKLTQVVYDFDFFFPLAGIEKVVAVGENPADVKAAEKMAKLHDELRRFNEYTSEDDLHDLNVFMTRLLFCFFAEDTGIFEKDIFTDFIRRYTREDGGDLSEMLDKVFNIMDEKERGDKINKMIAQFPYVNGGLFHSSIEIPNMGVRARRIILECAELNWSEINPDIFGSMMQAVVMPGARAVLGMHYTSVPNIMKVIQPLFLNTLNEAFQKSYDNVKGLDKLLLRISKMKFFDPACGSGNFLIIAYKELRKLEIEIWKRRTELTGEHVVPFTNININQFYGIEIDSFAHEVAMLSLWLAEHQMNMLFTKEFADVKLDALPLENIDTIVQGNACRIDWDTVCPHTAEEEVFIFGNPPYLGSNNHSDEQREDMALVFGTTSLNRLDYIGTWFILASRYCKNTLAKCALLSTNSIVQGVQVPFLWSRIFDLGVHISFAYRPFKWSNSAKHNAAVICVVIGLSYTQTKDIYLYDAEKKEKVKAISPYLTPNSLTIVSEKSKPQDGFPPLIMGNKPSDDGNLILDEYEKNCLISEYPEAKKYIKKFMSAADFLNGKSRYCLWIEDNEAIDAKQIPPIRERTNRLYQFRLESKAKSTHEYAIYDYKFRQISFLPQVGLVVPSVSSESRKYIPLDYISSNTIISNAANIVYGLEFWQFAFMTSYMHMVWVKTFAGRLEGRLRYSAVLCYNTFPYPKLTNKQKADLEGLAQEVLLVRENHTEKTLAEMYDPKKMPEDLRKAHANLDRAVELCYRSTPFDSDEERLAFLLKMYERANA